MADILIRMEMPKDCGKCFVGDRTICADGCVLIELPEHGDLISRDDAVTVLQSIGSRDYRREKGTICDAIKMISHERYVPTIDLFIATCNDSEWRDTTATFWTKTKGD